MSVPGPLRPWFLVLLFGTGAYAQSDPASAPAADADSRAPPVEAPSEPEPAKPEPAKPEPMADVYFSVYIWPTEGILTADSQVAPLPRTYFDGIHGMERIHLHRGGTSEVHRYQGPLPLKIYDVERVFVPAPEEAGPDAEPILLETRLPVLRASFPVNARRMILIALPHERDSDGAMVSFPMPLLNRSLSNGDVSVYNAGDRPVVFSLGDGDPYFVIQSLQTLMLSGRRFDSRNPRVRIHRQDDSGNPRLAASTRMYVDPEKVNYFFLYPKGERNMRLLRVGAHNLPAAALQTPSE
ncbi:MAG: hypothetical protein JJU05_09430 [Verrucomicrobia bacterium]|nr:hypothetical protein [Verrucomicrobiota bacterium]MCH8526027.1 hypothetical protein [Kiritimatiellia bacterium]